MFKKYLLLAAFAQFNFSQAQTCSDPGDNFGDIGCVEFNYEGNTVQYATVRGNDGNIWLQQNLGSSQVATAIDDEASYGDLFQWGRWSDGHQLRNSPTATATTNNPSGIMEGNSNYITGWWTPNTLTDQWNANIPSEATDTNGCDPCKALGQGWSLPTTANWTAVTAGQITNPAKAFESFLKLPGNGYRASSNGSFTFVGARGYYWSNQTSDSGGKYLYIGSTIANPTAGGPRGQGAGIRCLKTANLGTGEFSKKNYKIFPNPTEGLVEIETDLPIDTISIYSPIGQLIYKQKSSKIDLSSFSAGLYVIKITFENGQTAVNRIVKK